MAGILVPHAHWLVLFVTLVAASIALSLEHWDEPVAMMARATVAASPTLHAFFQTITHLGLSGWILVLSALLAVSVAAQDLPALDKSRRSRRAAWHGLALFAFAAVAATGTLASLVKNTIGRARPRHLDELGALHFDPGAFTASFASFPSGHSTTIGALCTVLALLAPRWWPAWLLVALLAGGSRVMVGAHYPSDVLAGLAFGAAGSLAIAYWLAGRRLLFRVPAGGLWPRLRRPL